jgi:hypothetical protein
MAAAALTVRIDGINRPDLGDGRAEGRQVRAAGFTRGQKAKKP